MNTDTQKPSEHAIDAAQLFYQGIAAALKEPASSVARDDEHTVDLACIIDKHAIAPAVAERDKRISELEAIVRASYLYALGKLSPSEQHALGEKLAEHGSAGAVFDLHRQERPAMSKQPCVWVVEAKESDAWVPEYIGLDREDVKRERDYFIRLFGATDLFRVAKYVRVEPNKKKGRK